MDYQQYRLSILCLKLLFLASIVMADSGNDFTNNLATDIAPLLALFGEQVTKQFMAGSMGWKDNIIFAMGALGIITAIVGAIRVSSPAWLKAIIGRARESWGDVEVELMSSTSEDVCELWNGRAIVRVLGTPSIVELVLSPDDDKDVLLDPRHGIRSFTEALQDGIIESTTFKHEDKVDLEDLPLADEEFRTSPPNIALSVNGGGASDSELFLLAVFGIFVQSAVVCLAAVETLVEDWKPRFENAGEPVGTYAFPLMVIGTALLVVGMMMCSHIIESSSKKGQWAPVRSDVTLAWLQRGTRISDQEFESFAISSQGDHRLRKSNREYDPGKETQTVIATMISVVGFVAQFSALRFLHWSVTICQLVAIGIMTALRAVVRRHIAYPPKVQPLPNGYELDWMARELKECKSWRIVSSKTASTTNSEAAITPETGSSILASQVLNARKRLESTSGWTSQFHGTAKSLSSAVEALMNSAYPGYMQGNGDFEWKLNVSVSKLGRNELGFVGREPRRRTESVTIAIKRKKIEGDWKWKVDATEIVAILGLWMLDYHEQVPDKEDSDGRRSLRILGHLDDENEEFKLWMPAGLEYHKLSETQVELSEMLIPSHRLFPRSMESVGGMLTIIVETPPQTIFAQILFSMLLAQIAEAIGPISDATSFAAPKAKFDSYGLASQIISRIADDLGRVELATVGNAYVSIVPELQMSKLLPRSTDSRALLSILRDIKRQEREELFESAENAALWVGYRIEIASRTYRMKQAWKEAGDVYIGYHNACQQVYGAEHFRTRDADRRRLNFKDYQSLWEELPEKYSEVNKQNSQGESLLIQELRNKPHCDESAVALLIDLNAAVDAKDKKGKTALHYAVENRQIGMVELLLSFNQELIFEVDASGRTPLTVALEYAELQITRMLLFYDGNDRSKGHSLLCAATMGNNDLIELLLKNGADMEATDGNGDTVLHLAAANGQEDAVNFLLENGGEILLVARNSEMKRTPLHLAALNGCDKIARMLLEKGADVQAKDGDQETPLHLACSKGHAGMIKLLIERAADLMATDQLGWTPLYKLVAECDEVAVADVLRKNWGTMKVSSRNSDGWTAMHRAAANNFLSVVHLLLANGAMVSAEDDHGWTPLHGAAFSGHREMVQLLLDKGANVEASDGYKWTPLHGAALNGWAGIAKLLIKKGANVRAKNADGWEALHEAAFNEHTDLVQLLLENGAETTARNNQGKTAMDIAKTSAVREILINWT